MNSVIWVFGILSVLTASGEPNPAACKSQEAILKPPFCFYYYHYYDLNALIKFRNLSPYVTYTIYETDFHNHYHLSKLPEDKINYNYGIKRKIEYEAIRIYIELRTKAGWCKNVTIFEGRQTPQDRDYFNHQCLTSTELCRIEVDLKNDCSDSPYTTSDKPQDVTNKPFMMPKTANPKLDDVDEGVLSTTTYSTTLVSSDVTSSAYEGREITTSNIIASTSQEAILKPPFCFYYYNYYDLKALIKFRNLSPYVTYTIYETDFHNHYHLSKLPEDKINYNYGIKRKVEYEAIRIYIELRTKAGWCKSVTIFEGRQTPQDRDYHNDLCLRSTEPCRIEVDLKNDCSDSPYTTSDNPQDVTNNPFMMPKTAIPKLDDVDEGVLSTTTYSTTLVSSDVTSSAYEGREITTSNIIASTKSAGILTQSPQSDWYKYAIPSLIVTFVIILVIYISVKRHCYRNSHPVETMELNIYSTANQVVYADLSLAHGDRPPKGRGEESPYAQIIGVMKPVDSG